MDVGLDVALGQFEDWLAAQGASRRTLRERLTIVAAFGTYVGVDPRGASTQDVIRYLSRTDLAAWSKATYWNHLRSWFAWMQTIGLEASPMDGMKPPRTPKGSPRPLTQFEVDLLLERAKPRMHSWLVLGLYAGLRAHEIAKIKGSDVTELSIFVVGKGGVAAHVPTVPVVWAEARGYDRGVWFPSKTADGHIRAETVSHTSAQFFHHNGVEGAIHRCRHTFATNLLRAGVDIRQVQQLMRHANLNTTALYTAVDNAQLRDAVLRIRGAA